MEILNFKDLGDTSVVSDCTLGVNLVIDILFYVATGTSRLYTIWKQSGPLVMEILHFEHLAANAVVLIIGGYQISIANYLRGGGGIYPHIKLKEIRADADAAAMIKP